ncbi:hypothetical protein [Gordonia sp. NPDC003422]
MPKPKPVRVKHVVATLFAGACVTAAALPAMVGGAHVSVEPAPGRSASSGPPIVVVSKKVVVPRWAVPAAPVGRETTLNTTISTVPTFDDGARTYARSSTTRSRFVDGRWWSVSAATVGMLSSDGGWKSVSATTARSATVDDQVLSITTTVATPVAGDAESLSVTTTTARPMFGDGGWLYGNGRDALVVDPDCTSNCVGEDGGLLGGDGGDGAFGGAGGSAWLFGNGGRGGDGLNAVYDSTGRW